MRGNVTASASALFGAWLVVAPFAVFEATLAPNFWSDVLAGVSLLAVAAYSVVRALRGRRLTPAAPVFVGLVGVLQFVQPFAVGSVSAANRWSDVVVGALLVGVALLAHRSAAARNEESARAQADRR
ncbi:SPW repeat domain-containing protein [Halomicrococcus gelatinilyticus]|uniref:SPW repeat domain-containing protein n=1 Tax=Halomicrococcus gelatinilyticus TaxID=1702103 RepID=UPI002E109DD3